jgi:hypothetical protein
MSCLVGSVLLLVAGVGKVRRPAGTVRALRTQGLAVPAAAVRVLGVVEVAVAVLGLAGSRPALAVTAACFAGFTGFVLLALVRGRPLSSCGCFGEPDLPPTPAHAVLTGALALAAALAAAGPAGLPAVWAGGPAVALTTVLLTALLVALCLLLLTGLPRLVAARTLVRPVPDARHRRTA